MEKRFVYADNAATTPVAAEVVEAMMPCLKDIWGNPSSMHSKGAEAKERLDEARSAVATCLHCTPKEIFFTSCGSESDNWALRGAVAKSGGKKHIITSKFEHHAILHTCATLEKEGYRVTYLDVDNDGFVQPDVLRRAIDSDTAIVSIMMANNEIGTIQPIRELTDIAHEAGALMMTDAVQAVGAIPVNPTELGVDLLSLSGHKFHAPKGIGALYIRRGVSIGNLIEGGGQERRRRAGTENVAYAVGMARALQLATERLPDMARVAAMRDRLIDGLLQIPASRLHGARTNRLPGNCNIGFDCIEGESMLLLLDMAGIAASTGSACSSDSLEPSHVLLSIGVPHEKAHGSLRFSLSHENTDDDVNYILQTLPPIIERLRAMSPIWNQPRS